MDNIAHYNLNSEVYVNSGTNWVTGTICGYDKNNNSYTIFCKTTGITLVDIPEYAVFPLFKYIRHIVTNNDVRLNNSLFTPVASYATQTEKEKPPRFAECVVTLQHELLRLRQRVEAISPSATPATSKETVVTNDIVETNDKESLYSLPSNLSDIFDSQSVDIMSSTNKSESSKSDQSELSNESNSRPLNGTFYVPTKGMRNGKRKSSRVLESKKKRPAQTHI